MSNELFIVGSLLFFLIFLRGGIKVLHREEWQFLASISRKRLSDGTWSGLNLTYYGVFNALAHVLSLVFLLILTSAIGIAPGDILCIILVLMSFCLPASRILAKWIERKDNTFTVGGATFVGIVMAPAAVWLCYSFLHPHLTIPLTPILAAMAIAYAIGEGIGRLACISFGCCYGKPLKDCPASLQRLFHYGTVVYSGKTKKIAYESGLDGQAIFPIQAVTSVLFILTAITCAYMFLKGWHSTAFLICTVITQGWRPLSEQLRADYRGGGTVSVYQILAILAMLYAIIIWFFLPPAAAVADVWNGIRSLWHPAIILFLQFWGMSIFWYTGKSRVTGVHMSFHVHKELI
ncbi:MAG: prolipoprotein diacylglyceryl transferase [Syntrophales bacterium]|nr:prolipoprotein diacylglyceryl transferase [Syntrophales bacterium]